MSIFDAYDSEFTSLSQDISRNISDFKANTSNSDKCASINRHVDALLLQAGDLLKQMEVEVRSHDSATRKVLTEKVNQYKRVLSSLRTDFGKAKEESERGNLFAGTKSGEDRQRLLNTNEKLSRQNETILSAQRTVAATEDVAMDITNELARNREKIESSRDKVREFTGMTDTARRLINSMSRREVQQKMIMGFIAFVLVAAIGIVIWFTSIKK